MATQAQYIATPRSSTATITTANTSFAGDGAMSIVFTAGALGARIERVVVAATASTTATSTTAGIVCLFVSSDAAANTTTSTHLYDSVPVTAVNATSTVAPFQATRSEANANDKWPLILGPGQTLRASTTVAQNFRVTAVGGDY